MQTHSSRSFSSIIFGILFFVALLGAFGCSDDDPADPALEAEPEFLATTPDSLASLFRIAYQEMQIDDFTALLHPDFEMILLADTLEDWGWPEGYTFDRAEMVSIHENIFLGQVGEDRDGNLIQPIGSIEVPLLWLDGEWGPILEDDLNFADFEGMWGLFEVNFQFYNAAASHRHSVQQQVKFYVAPVVENGTTRYELLGINGLPLYRKTEQINWGGFLTRFQDIVDPQ